MRKFMLENEYGVQIPLQYSNIFLYDPSGLGTNDGDDYDEVNGFFIKTSTKTSQTPIQGIFVFDRINAYQNYRAFTDWVYNGGKLKLGYTTNTEWYYIDISIKSLEKSELNNVGTLEIPFTFLPLSPWYKQTQTSLYFNVEGNTSEKRYNYSYPYSYSDTAVQNMVEFNVGGHYDGDVILKINGYLSSPILTVTNNDTQEIIGKLDLTGTTIEIGQQLVFSTKPTEAGVFMVENGEQTNLINQIVVSASIPTFFKLQKNTTFSAEISASNTITSTGILSILEYYKTR